MLGNFCNTAWDRSFFFLFPLIHAPQSWVSNWKINGLKALFNLQCFSLLPRCEYCCVKTLTSSETASRPTFTSTRRLLCNVLIWITPYYVWTFNLYDWRHHLSALGVDLNPRWTKRRPRGETLKDSFSSSEGTNLHPVSSTVFNRPYTSV